MGFRRVLLRHGLVLIGIAMPSLVWLAPVLRHPLHTVVGWEGDNLYYVHQFWWMKHALLDLHRAPFFDPNSYYPLGYSMSRGELTPANTFFLLPVTLLAGPVAAYNAAVVLGFVLTAWAAYAWVFRLSGGSRIAGATAGVIASMAPYRLAHAAGHLPLITTEGFVLALWTFEECVRATDARRAGWAVALGVSLAVSALASWYYAYSLALMFPLYVLARTWTRRDLWMSRSWQRGLALALVVAAALVLPFAIPYARASLGGALHRKITLLEYWALNWYDFFLPNVAHPLWSAWMLKRFPQEGIQWVERDVALGYVALALSVFATLSLWRRSRAIVAPLAIVALLSGAIALGPTLHSGDRPVTIPLQYPVMKVLDSVLYRVRPHSQFREQLRAQQVTVIPLPAVLLFFLVPGASGMRSMARFAYWTVLMIGALAGLAMRDVARRAFAARPAAGGLLVFMLLSGVVFESWTHRFVSAWGPREVDRWVAQQPASDVVLELPLSEALRPAQDYYVTVHQHPTIFGPNGDSFPPPVQQDRAAVLSAPPSESSVAALRGWGATLVLVHSAAAPGGPAWSAVLSRAGAREVARFEDVRVYRVAR